MIRRYLPKDLEQLVHWYERYISPIGLVAGFLSDNFFLLKRVDLFRTNALLFSYLAIAALGILLLNAVEAGRLRAKWLQKISPLIPVVVQFCFGGLFSGYLSLYSRSASIAISWIFVLGLAALLLGNERFTRLYRRLAFQVALYFFVLFSFLEFFLPVVLRQIGPMIFFGSGVVSLLIIALFLLALAHIAPEQFRAGGMRAVLSVGAIFIIFNVLYFTNVIPPLPLALKTGGVYHSIAHEPDGSYQLLGEALPWYEEYLNYPPVYHHVPGDPVYVFSSVFAPTGLSTTIAHQWQFYDATSSKWETRLSISFPISGGQDGGYHGYSEVFDPAPGKWRVNVITQYGQLIGRISFTVVDVSAEPPLIASTQ